MAENRIVWIARLLSTEVFPREVRDCDTSPVLKVHRSQPRIGVRFSCHSDRPFRNAHYAADIRRDSEFLLKTAHYPCDYLLTAPHLLTGWFAPQANPSITKFLFGFTQESVLVFYEDHSQHDGACGPGRERAVLSGDFSPEVFDRLRLAKSPIRQVQALPAQPIC